MSTRLLKHICVPSTVDKLCVYDGTQKYVLKQIHHEPCNYYKFGEHSFFGINTITSAKMIEIAEVIMLTYIQILHILVL